MKYFHCFPNKNNHVYIFEKKIVKYKRDWLVFCSSTSYKATILKYLLNYLYNSNLINYLFPAIPIDELTDSIIIQKIVTQDEVITGLVGGRHRRNRIYQISSGSSSFKMLKIFNCSNVNQMNKELYALRYLYDKKNINSYLPKILSLDVNANTPYYLSEGIIGEVKNINIGNDLIQFLEYLPALNKFVEIGSHLEVKRIIQSLQNMPILSSFLSQYQKLLNHIFVKSVFEHGDFVYWNILYSGNSTKVIDWEYSNAEGVPVFDFIHYLIMPSLVVKKQKIDICLLIEQIAMYLRVCKNNKKIDFEMKGQAVAKVLLSLKIFQLIERDMMENKSSSDFTLISKLKMLETILTL